MSTATNSTSGTLRNKEEGLIFVVIAGTYAFYLSGTLYVVGSLIGWALFLLMLLRAFVSGRWPAKASVPALVWLWALGMSMMLVALLIAHSDYAMGLGATVKSSVGWAKGWALLALFPLLGSIMAVRPAVLTRACCVMASQSWVFVFLSIPAIAFGMDGGLFVSPLKAVGGPISTFEVGLYGMNPETGRPRWSFFAPWAPAAGLMSCLLLVICAREKNTFWRRMGMSGAAVMCIFCQSRAGWAIFLGLLPTLYVIRYLAHPKLILLVGVLTSSTILLGQPVINGMLDVHQQVKDSRAGSTRVREALAAIAIQRWESEAPIWGHGVVEQGPKLVEYMPIGSHHSWYGLLFVKGVVGLLSLAIPLVLCLIYLLTRATVSTGAQSAFLLLLVIAGYSFFENLEILAYLYWPALIWIGMALNPLREGEL